MLLRVRAMFLLELTAEFLFAVIRRLVSLRNRGQ
jgi:hypothetical protein